MQTPDAIDRRSFLRDGTLAGSAAILAAQTTIGTNQLAQAQASPARTGKRTRVAVIGCGSVSGVYLPHLKKSEFVELVSTCDIMPERAERRAKEFQVAKWYPHIDQLLAGPPFDLLVNLTDMQEHEHLNRQALEAGRHVWSEKPMANSVEAGQALLELASSKNIRIWGAPTVVNSPQFRFMAETLAAGKLGRVAAAHADYGHTGPGWSSFFYEPGGGSMPDLGVYNLTSLTGLLGPARSVVAMTSIVTPTRNIDRKGEIKVNEEDNAMIIMDHGQGILSHVMCGFNFFNPHGHEGSKESRHTITIYGSHGSMGLVGYDWEPLAVDLATHDKPESARFAAEPHNYVWQQGASLVAESLATGNQLLVTPEHALHVVEIMLAARSSQKSGQRIDIKSKFHWPVI